MTDPTVDRRVTVRRAPKYPRFIILGAGLGAVVTFVLTNLFPVDPLVGFGPLFGYLLLFGVPAGAALGAIVAILLDAVATRRAREVEAERVPSSGDRSPDADQTAADSDRSPDDAG
jgi:pimeloyl-ACP methyl ester carboxylesterase